MQTLSIRNIRRACGVALVVALVTAIGCGRASTFSATYCRAVSDIVNYDDGLRGDTDAAAVKAAGARVLTGTDSLVRVVSDEGSAAAKTAVARWRNAYVTARDAGTAPFDQLLEPTNTLVRTSTTGCNWHRQTFSATSYRFEDVPAHIAAGTIALRLKNHSQEPHLFLLARVKDGVTKPLDALVDEFRGPDTAPDADIEFMNTGAFAMPGQDAFGVATLQPGRYLYLCPLPVGNDETDSHARHGMKGELSVS